jgi:hypothetical protein
MNPAGADVQVSIPLRIVQNAFLQQQLDQNFFIADKVFGRVPVQLKRANYRTWDIADWLRADAQRRAPGTESAGGGYRETEAPLYNCYVTAFHKDLDEQTEAELIANGNPNPRATDTRYVTRQLLMRRELDFHDSYMTTGVWGADWQGVATPSAATDFDYWNDSASTPIDIVAEIVDDIIAATGMVPNTMLMSRRVRRALRRNAQIISEAHAIAQRTGEPLPTDALLADLFEIPNIIVSNGYYNTAAEDTAMTKTIVPIFNNMVWIGYVEPTADLEMPSAGRIFTWDGYNNGDSGFDGNGVYEIPMPTTKSVRIEGELAYDMRVVAPELGVLLSTVLDPATL